MSKAPSSENLFIDGPVGRLEAIIESPADGVPMGIAVVCHPHPQHGGTMHNKVAHTLARAFVRLDFSAQSTDQLPPEVARAYNIVRSKNRAILNVSILRASDSQAVTADVTVKTVNLTGQLKNVTMRQINEQEAIYYIGEVAVANRETLIFDISVTPDGEDSPSEIRFKRQFYTD